MITTDEVKAKLHHTTPSERAMQDVLNDARLAVFGDRNRDYGPPEENHKRTAELWTAYLGVRITPRQVCLMNVLQKCSRDAHHAKQDNLTDIIGFAANAAACTAAEPPQAVLNHRGY